MSDENIEAEAAESGGPAIAAQIARALAANSDGANGAIQLTVDDLLRCTRDQLLGFAKRLGLTGVSKLAKPDLAERLHESLRAHAGAGASAPSGGHEIPARAKSGGEANGHDARNDGAPAAGDEAVTGFPPKYDLGPDAEEPPMPRHIPWGYGQDRVTAMVVDPDRLFVYWEVTDDAIARARRELGKDGAGAWLSLRVYDITGRLFDGTNAHSYFDHKIERGDRQWFFDINKPTSGACVEVGLKSGEGFFVKVARSGRVEFPRRDPVPGGHVEWLTVTTASGPHAAPVPGGGGGEPASSSPAAAPGWKDGEGAAAAAPRGGEAGGVERFPAGEHFTEQRWEWREGEHEAWQTELASISWTEPVIRSTWEAGPFSYPVESPVFSEEHLGATGQLHHRIEGGRVHITYGPWQVVIRGLGARAERRVLATWEYRRTVEMPGGFERD
ncbi:MAG TPA: DUF4912 domain-containing protein, partial [Polyangia bacterium]|nr:DUF4912 domain-containing protein [Polyangia bacterium]